MKFFLVTLCFIFYSCLSQKNLANLKVKQDSTLTLLVQDDYFVTDSMETDVIRDEKTLKSFFAKVNKTRKPGLPVPSVDFENEMVLVVCMGEQKSNGIPYLELLKSSPSELLLAIKTEKKNKDKNNIFSYPFCVYKMPITDKEIIFKDYLD